MQNAWAGGGTKQVAHRSQFVQTRKAPTAAAIISWPVIRAANTVPQWGRDDGIRDYSNIMASNHRQGGGNGGGDDSARRRPPEWADGLKQLYDSVVEEALPDSFKDLLDQLDGLDSGGPSPGSNDNGKSAPDGRA